MKLVLKNVLFRNCYRSQRYRQRYRKISNNTQPYRHVTCHRWVDAFCDITGAEEAKNSDVWWSWQNVGLLFLCKLATLAFCYRRGISFQRTQPAGVFSDVSRCQSNISLETTYKLDLDHMFSPLADSFLVLMILAAYSWPDSTFTQRRTTENAPLEMQQTTNQADSQHFNKKPFTLSFKFWRHNLIECRSPPPPPPFL